MELVNVPRDFRTIEIRPADFVGSFWKALFDPTGRLVDDALIGFLALDVSSGGFGWSVLSEDDYEMVRRMILSHGSGLVATGAHEV